MSHFVLSDKQKTQLNWIIAIMVAYMIIAHGSILFGSLVHPVAAYAEANYKPIAYLIATTALIVIAGITQSIRGLTLGALFTWAYIAVLIVVGFVGNSVITLLQTNGPIIQAIILGIGIIAILAAPLTLICYSLIKAYILFGQIKSHNTWLRRAVRLTIIAAFLIIPIAIVAYFYFPIRITIAIMHLLSPIWMLCAVAAMGYSAYILKNSK